MVDLYRPSSGTEGADFDSEWCCRCKADQAMRDETGDGCEIIANSFAFAVDDPNYPQQWRYERGEPVCTAFEAVDPLDQPFLRSAAVRDLFPGCPRRPTQGEQIHMMIGASASA